MKIETMREALKAAYPNSGERYARKVDQYSDEQVKAVYSNLKQQKKV